MFWGLTGSYGGNYGAPGDNYFFEAGFNSNVEPVMDDPNLHGYNVEVR